MNPNLVRIGLKLGVGLVGSLVIGTLIKGEHRLAKEIDIRWPATNSTNPS